MDEDDDLPITGFDRSPSLVQSLAEQPLGRPSIPDAPDVSGFSRPMPRPTNQPPEEEDDNLPISTLNGNVSSTPPVDEDDNLPITSLNTLRPFAPGEKRDNADGSYSTEVTRTVETPDGWAVVPSLWMGPDGPVDLGEDDDDQISEVAQQYEQTSGQKFPRFQDLDQAEAWAEQRSAGGGASETPLTSAQSSDEDELPISELQPKGFLGKLQDINKRMGDALWQQGEEGQHTQADILADPDKMATIRQYMVNRMGEQWKKRSDEEVMDAFVGHMRFFGANDFRAVSELGYNIKATPEQKQVAAQAYKTFDELSSMFTNDGISGAVGGAWDYAKATALSPTTYLGALIGGKVVNKALSTAAKEALVRTATIQALETGGPQAAKEVTKAAVRQRALATAIIATPIDAGTNVFQDLAYQQARVEVGAQDKVDPLELGFAAAGGVAGGALGYASQAGRGVSRLDRAEAKITSSKAKRAATAGAVAGPKIAKSVKASVNKLTQDLTQWKADVAAGKAINPEMTDMSNITSWFFDKNDPDSIFRIITDSGADIDLSDDAHFTSQLVDFARQLPADSLDEINQALEPMGVNFGQMLDIVAATQNAAGTSMNKASQAKVFAKEVAGVAAKNKEVDTAILNGVKDLGSKDKKYDDPQTVRYITSLWRRMLISNPATSALNAQGWGTVFTARTMAEVLHGGVLGTAGLAQAMVTGRWRNKALGQSKALMKNQAFKLRMALDPYTSFEGFQAILKTADKKTQKEVENSFFGGVSTSKTAAETYGFKPDNKLIAGTEKIADIAASATFVKAQDIITKTVSGLSELDKIARLQYGKGIDELIDGNETHTISREMWQTVVNQMNKDTMSADYTKGNGALASMARLVEGASNTPYIGFLFPFGKFMNNNIATFFEYSPLAIFPIASKIYKRSAYDTTEKLSRAAVGTAALGTLFAYTKEMQDRGMAWWANEESDGTVENQQNLAPTSLFKLVARMSRLFTEGEGIPTEMYKELGDQLGIGQWAQELKSNNALGDFLKWAAEPDHNYDANAFLGYAIQTMASIGSGFTRPIDPINDMVGWVTEGDVSVDRRQNPKGGLDAVTGELTRYTNNLFAPFFGKYKTEEGVPVFGGPPARSATGPAGDIHDPNPMSSFFSRKEEPPMTAIKELLGMVNLPTYIFDSRTNVPEFDIFMNEKILPLLNFKARNFMNSPGFKQLSQFEKVAETRRILQESQQQIIDDIENGTGGGPNERLYNARRNWSSVPASDRVAAKREFNLDKPDNELSEEQIDMMKDYIKTHNETLKYMRE